MLARNYKRKITLYKVGRLVLVEKDVCTVITAICIQSHSWFTARCKPLVKFKNRKAKLTFPENTLKCQHSSFNHALIVSFYFRVSVSGEILLFIFAIQNEIPLPHLILYFYFLIFSQTWSGNLMHTCKCSWSELWQITEGCKMNFYVFQ